MNDKGERLSYSTLTLPALQLGQVRLGHCSEPLQIMLEQVHGQSYVAIDITVVKIWTKSNIITTGTSLRTNNIIKN